MVLRNVQPTFTFEEQRVEINELAADVDSINAGYNNTDWDTAFSWGNHATQNYIVNGTFSNVTINAGITTRNLTITDDGSASPILVSKADDQSVWNLSLQNDSYSTNGGTGTKYFMASDGTAKWYHYGYSTFENTEFYTARVTGSPSSHLALRLDTSGGVQLMYQGSEKFSTNQFGVYVTGNLSLGTNPSSNPKVFLNSDGSATFENTVIADGTSTTNNRLVVRTSNDEKFTVIGDGTVEIGGTPGTSPNIKLYASGGAEFAGGIDLAATDVNGSSINTFGGYTVQGDSGLRVVLDGYNQTTNTVRILTDGSATFSGTVVSDPTATNVAGYAYEVKNGATSLGGLYKTTSNGGFLQLNNGSGTQTASINGEDGSATFASNTTVGSPDVTNASTGGVQVFASGQLRIQRDSAGTASDKRFQMYYGTTETASITAAGAATFEEGLSVGYGTSSASTVITRWRSDVVSANSTVASINADGSATFNETLTIGSGSAGPDDYGLIAYADADSLSNKSAVYARNLNAGGRTFTGDNETGTTTFEVYGNGTVNASNTITAPFIRGDGSDGTSADTALFRNLTSGGDNRVRINTYANGGGHPYLKFDAGGSNFVVGELYAGSTNNKLVLGVGEDPTAITGISIDGNGNVTANNLALNQTNGSGATSTVLDHYEEGTWTPSWGSTTGSITNVTYNVQSGWYTRVGRVVYVHCRLRSTATDTSGAGGGLLVNGLPFTVRSPQGTGGAAAYSLIDFPDTAVHVVTETRENTTQFYAGIYTLDNGSFGNIGPGSLQSSGNSEIRVSFFYMTDT